MQLRSWHHRNDHASLLGSTMATPSQDLDPQPLMTLDMAPFAGVVLSLLALWFVAMPRPQHAVSLDITGHCGGLIPSKAVIHTLGIDVDGTVTWNGETLSNRAALDARLQAVATAAMADQAEVHIHPHQLADFGVVAGVLASAQRHGVRNLGLIGADLEVFPSHCGSSI